MKTASLLSMLCASASMLTGCAIVGPTSIAEGRHVYNEVINRTEDEQILRMIVRERYDETFGLLAVASVTANISTTAHVSSNIGIGSDNNYAGNLVPLSFGFAYEENPTISYVPLSGEDFMQRILSPLTLDQTVLALGTGNSDDRLQMFNILLGRINGLANPIAGGTPPSPEFNQFSDLHDLLHDAAAINIALGKDKGDYYVVIHDYGEELRPTVEDFLRILGLEGFAVDGSRIVIPLQLSIGSRNSQAIEIATRSVMELIRGVGAAIDVPHEHLESGIADAMTWAQGESDQFLHIRTSTAHPDNATVAIFHRGYWFYIDATDSRSKRSFILLKTLIGMRMQSAGGSSQAPVLTIGVGK